MRDVTVVFVLIAAIAMANYSVWYDVVDLLIVLAVALSGVFSVREALSVCVQA